MTDRCGTQISDLSQMLSLGYLLPTAGVQVVVIVIIITIIISAANIYLALMLYMSNLIYCSQKSYTVRYAQLISHFADEETD